MTLYATNELQILFQCENGHFILIFNNFIWLFQRFSETGLIIITALTGRLRYFFQSKTVFGDSA